MYSWYIYKWGPHCLCTQNIPCENGLYMTVLFFVGPLPIILSLLSYQQTYMSALLLGFSSMYSIRLKRQYLTLTVRVGYPACDLTLLIRIVVYLHYIIIIRSFSTVCHLLGRKQNLNTFVTGKNSLHYSMQHSPS